MNDLEMYREQLGLCDDKIIDALVERNAIIEKIMAYMECRSCSRSSRRNRRRGWKRNLPITSTKRKSMMFSVAFCVTARESRPENYLITILC